MDGPLPKVSCYCATYGRPWALEESLESFLRQDYQGPKELIIFNDYAGHTLHFDHPEVKIINVTEHIIPLGKKFNETVALCDGDVLLPWEDDDIFLPNRISYSVDHLVDGLFHTHSGWYDQGDHVVIAGNHFHCNLAVSRALWNKVGWYAEIDRCDIDVELMKRLFDAAPQGRQLIAEEDIFYIYRWETSGSFHASGWGTDPSVRASIGAEQIVAEQARQGRVPQGAYLLHPTWKYDYAAAAKIAARKGS